VDKSFGINLRSFFLRGPQNAGTVNRIGGNPIVVQRARTLKGAIRKFGTGLGYAYLESEVVVTLDEMRTVDVNRSRANPSAGARRAE
jgi:hypothetical protein